MEIRRIRLEINGVVCGLITQESEEYMKALADEVGDMMKQVLNASPFVTREAAALTAALSYCDDAKKNGKRAAELQERVDELEVEAELWQEEKSKLKKVAPAAEDPAVKERLRELEERNTRLEETAAGLRELEERAARLEDENAALRETAHKAEETLSGLKQAERELQALKRENEALKAKEEEAKRQLSAAAKAKENETGSSHRQEPPAVLPKAAENGMESSVQQGQAVTIPKAAENSMNLPAQQDQTVTIRKKRKNPLRHEDEYEQEGFVSFFEKKE